MTEEETITCDVCNAEIPADSDVCPNCGSKLKIKDENERKKDRDESIEDVMEYIIGEDDDKELLDKIKTVGSKSEEPVVEDELNEIFEGYEENVKFECPVCESVVSADDSVCPNCGAIFETDEEYEEEIDELKEGIDLIESELDNLKDSEIDTTYLKNGLNDLIESYQEGRYDEGLDILGILETQISDIREIIDAVQNSRDDLEKISDETDTTSFEKRIEDVIDKSEVGEYKAALKKAKELKDEIRSVKDDIIEKEGSMKEEMENKMQEAKSKLSEVRKSKIDISDVKEFMKSAVSEKKEDNYSKAADKAGKVIERSNTILGIMDMIEDGKNKIKVMKEKNIPYKSHLEKLKNAKAKSDENQYQTSKDILKEALQEIDEDLEQYEEEIADEKKELNEELENVLEIANNKLEEAKETVISIKPLKEIIEEAKQAREVGEFDKAIEKARSAKNHAEDLFENNDLILETKSRLLEMKEQNLEYKELLKDLKKAKKMADEGDYEDSIEKTKDIFSEAEVELGELEKEEKRKQLKEDIKILTAKIDDRVEISNELNADTRKALNRKASALDKKEDGSLEECKEDLKKAVEMIHDSIEDKVEEELMELELSLEDSWDEESADDAEKLIREIREDVDDRKYDDLDGLLEEAREKAEEALGPISKLEEDISNLEDLIFEVKILEYDVSDTEDDIENAKDELELGDWEAAEKYIQSAEEKLANKIPDLLKSEIKEARDELRSAKIKGIDISKAVGYIKDVKLAQKNNRIKKAFKKYKKFKEEMKKIRKQY